MVNQLFHCPTVGNKTDSEKIIILWQFPLFTHHNGSWQPGGPLNVSFLPKVPRCQHQFGCCCSVPPMQFKLFSLCTIFPSKLGLWRGNKPATYRKMNLWWRFDGIIDVHVGCVSVTEWRKRRRRRQSLQWWGQSTANNVNVEPLLFWHWAALNYLSLIESRKFSSG